MIDSSKTIIFEHPLNEKTRTNLRLEYLLKQINANKKIACTATGLTFFRAISDLLDIIERCDIRSDLVKELEKQQQKLLPWSDVPGVDIERLNNLRDKLRKLSTQLWSITRLGQDLKEDRFITSIRQRLAIPGGCCSFDLPTLHVWLDLPQIERDHHVLSWLEHLSLLDEALNVCMSLIRHAANFRQYLYSGNFSQENSENVDLVRIRIPSEPRIYPQISGHKSRFAVRFVPFDAERDALPQEYQFELACC